MEPHTWKRPWSRLLKGKAIEVETSELYLKLTGRCMEQMNRLSSPYRSPLLKFNLEQCNYLATKLQLAIQSANCIIKDVNKEFLSLAHSKKMEQCLEIFKLLNAMGLEVEDFIENCCKKAWIQSAIMLMGILEEVATIGLNLEFCTNIFCAWQLQKRTTLTHFDATSSYKAQIQIVKEKAHLDEAQLIMDLRNVIKSNASSSVERELATFLRARLGTAMLSPNIYSPSPHERVHPLMITNLQQMPECLGKGTFAIVHKANWFGIEVAKKTFYGPTSPDFFREVSILDGLDHPNIVSLLWSMTDGKRCHLVMELMDKDLFSLMHQRMEENKNQGSPFNIQEALALILQIGEGMLYLHEKRVVHRDLKSHNILIKCHKVAKGNVKYLQVKVADFGLSRTKEKSATYSDMSLNVGTTRWMAPEVMRVGNSQSGDIQEGTLKHPFKIDIYSFGMVCYEILSGEVPFSNLSHSEVKNAVLRGDRPLLPRECPYRLKTLIEACWSIEASKRPNFGSICEELRDLKYANLQIYWKAIIHQFPLEDILTIDDLLAKLSSKITKIQQSAANDIYFLAKKSFDHWIYIREQETMPLLVLLYYSRDALSKKQATIVLQALSIDGKGLYYDTSTQIHSLKELSLLHKFGLDSNFDNIFDEKIHLIYAIGPIIEVLKFGRMEAHKHATKALVKISSNLGGKVKEKIGTFEIVPSLITLLEGGSTEGKEYAAILLFKTCGSFLELPNAVYALIVPPVLNLIAQPSYGTMLDDAFKILVTLTNVHEGLIAIAAVGSIPILVNFIASKSHWNKDSAVLILHELCLHDPQFIKEARKVNAIEPLTHFAQHSFGPPSSKRLAVALLQLLQEGEEM